MGTNLNQNDHLVLNGSDSALSALVHKLQELQPVRSYDQSELAMARLYADVFRHHLRYNTTAKQWYLYDGRIWKEDAGGMFAADQAKLLSEALISYAGTIHEDKLRTEYLKFAIKYGTYAKRKTLVEDARSECFFSHENLDQDGDLYNCQNGIFNTRTLELLPHDPKYLLSKISNVHYDPDARAPDWEDKFIPQVMLGNVEKIAHLQKFAGLTLTTDTSEEKMLVFYGPTTRNGKSTYLETLAYMHGNTDGYSMNINPESLAARSKDTRHASGDIARLAGARMLVSAEPPKRMIFDAALLKSLLGRDTITARQLFQSEFEFTPVFKLAMNTNYLPLIQDDTLFTSGRIQVLTFDRHFEPNEQDTGLKNRLRSQENISGIFNWCVEGLRLYRETGFDPPPSVVEATAAYRDSSDKTKSFMSECLERSDENVAAGAVYRVYQRWCQDNGFGTESKRNFFEELKTKGIFAKSGVVAGSSIYNVVRGYRLIVDDDLRPSDPQDELPF